MDDELIYKDPKDQVDKVYEDDTYVIVSPLTSLANRYYGIKSPWYDDSWRGTRDFDNRLKSGGKIYYIVNKNEGTKHWFFRDQYGMVYNSPWGKMDKSDIDYLVKEYPEAKNEILKLTSSNTFKLLRKYASGKIDADVLEKTDDLIYDIQKIGEHPAQDLIILEFSTDEYFLDEILDLDTDDTWFVNRVNSGNFEFISSDTLWEQNKSGYGIFNYFNDSNIEKLKQIAKVITPGEFNTQDENYMGNLYRLMYDGYQRDVDSMDYDLMEAINTSAIEYARNEIEKDIEKYLEQKDFKLNRNYDRISTTVFNLIYQYSLIGKKSLPLLDMIKSVLKNDRIFGGWGSDYYEYEGRGLDDKKLNEEFASSLDNILDKMEENDGLKEFYELYERIFSKYKLGTWYETPKDKNLLFNIKKIYPDTLKIEINFKKRTGGEYGPWIKTHSFTEENFNKFLYQPELFDFFNEN